MIVTSKKEKVKKLTAKQKKEQKEKDLVLKAKTDNVVALLKKENLGLTLSQELFVQYFVMGGPDTKGNATWSYAHAYGHVEKLEKASKKNKMKKDEKTDEMIEIPKSSEYHRAFMVCGVEGNRVLNYPKIQARKMQLFNDLLDDKVVDNELSKIIQQDDLKSPTKIAAIKEFNALKQRTVKKIDVTTKSLGIVKHIYETDDPQHLVEGELLDDIEP